MSALNNVRKKLEKSAKAIFMPFRKVFAFAKKLSIVGVSPHDISRQAQRVSLLNLICMMVMARNVASILHFLWLGIPFHAGFMAITMVCYGLAIVLNHYRRYGAAVHLFLLVASGTLTYFSLTLGAECGIQMLLLPIPALAFLIHPPESKWERSLWVGVPVVILFLVTVWRAPLESYVTKIQLSPEEVRSQWLWAHAWTFFFIIFTARYFDKLTNAREIELADALDRLQVAYGMVVHDMASYVANTGYAAHLLEQKDLEPAVRSEVAAHLSRHIGRLGQLMDILRNQLEMQTFRGSQELKRVRLEEAFHEAIDLLKVRAKVSISHYEVAVSEAASRLAIAMKREELVQIIENLAANAAEAVSRAGYDQLVFLLDVKESNTPESQHVTLSFSDNGPGIPLDTMKEILSYPSSRDGERPRVARKSFGLKLIRKYVEMFGGRLHYQTYAEGPLVLLLKTAGKWGSLPGTTILLDIPVSMILHQQEVTADDASEVRQVVG